MKDLQVKYTDPLDLTPRQMNGLVNLVNANNVVQTKGALSEDHFLEALQKMWDHGAQGEYFAFVNANVKRMINQLAISLPHFEVS